MVQLLMITDDVEKPKFHAKPTKNCPIIHNVGFVLDVNILYIIATKYTHTEVNATAAYPKDSINLPVEKLGKKIPKKCIINKCCQHIFIGYPFMGHC